MGRNGNNWERLADGTNGIPTNHFVRVVREDPDRRGLLYAGTEFGMYISFDDGGSWQSFQQNLPVTPVTDLQVHNKDLVPFLKDYLDQEAMERIEYRVSNRQPKGKFTSCPDGKFNIGRRPWGGRS